MRKLNYNQLYYFHVVAEAGGLGKAAQRLGMAQSTLSEQIKLLERHLGTRLFHRTGRNLALSEAGRLAHEQTSTMFQASTHLLDAIASSKTAAVTVSIGVAATISRSLAARLFVPLFRREDLSVRMRHGEHAHLRQQLLAAELDILLSDVDAGDEQAGVCSEVVQCPAMMAVATPDFAKRIKDFPADLDELPYLAYTLHSQYRTELERYFYENAIDPHRIGEVDDVAIMLEVALQGGCFAILPEPVFRLAADEGAIDVIGRVDGLRSDVHAMYVDRDPSEPLLDVISLLRE